MTISNNIKIISKVLFVSFSFLLFISCEKEIDLDLDESEPLFVVEAIVHDSLGDNYVIITKTRNFKSIEPVEKISNANVQITDNLGNSFSLIETFPGFYTNTNLQGIANRTYKLDINIGGQIITAQSDMNPKVLIDSLTIDENLEVFWEDPNVPEYSALCHFTDPANALNFYRIKAFVGGEQDDGFQSFNDEFIDGKSTRIPIFESTFFKGDSITIQFLSVDEANYRYYTALRESQGGQVPGNPETNLEGDNVVGYFGAYAKSEESIVIAE